jgi:ATP-binding cassette subfamily B protein RaxB
VDDIEFTVRRRTPVIYQAEASECGLACLAMVAAYHRLEIDLVTLRQRFPTSLKGITLKHLLHIAEELGFSGRPLRLDVHDIEELTLPAILHWDLDHFVVLTRYTRGHRGGRYYVHDPASGAQTLTEAEFSDRFTGVALELVKSEQFRPGKTEAKLRIGQLWDRIEGFWPAVRQLVVLSAVLQFIALTTPLLMQVSIDNVLPTNDLDLLLILCLGFAGLSILSAATNWLRAFAIIRFSTTLSYQVTVNLFRHLFRLPLSWFEHRHVGDIISRFGSAKSVMDLIGQGLVSSFLDGIMAITTLVMMYIFSPLLASLAVAVVVITTCLRLGFFSALKQANVSVIATSARENSSFIETVRGVSTIKAFGDEPNRQRIWQNRKAQSINAEVKSGRLRAMFDAGEQAILGIERVLFVYLAIRQAMTGSLSVGIVFALQGYRQQFLDASSRLVQQGISYRLLDMHLSRIADIVLSPTEPLINVGNHHPLASSREARPAKIELRNVRFRYAPGEAEILKGVNLEIQANELVGFVGPSGCGKTTLMKIMMGLLMPSYGEVLIDGQPLHSYGLARWRREIGSVAQDDSLFAGSLGDNICLFDPEPDLTRIKNAARAASIAEDIEDMPMRFHTQVGDMGSALSGGQKQRVLLARAMYRQPRAIFLDEATAHLDPMNEIRISAVIDKFNCTRVLIAHRPQPLHSAARLFMILDGRVSEIEGRTPNYDVNSKKAGT